MAIDSIIEKIISEAQADAASIEKEGEEKAARLVEAFEKKARDEQEALKVKSQRDVAEIHNRSQLISRLEVRKNTLAARRAMLDQAFAAASRRLAELSGQKWEAFTEKLILESVATGREKLRVPQKDVPLYKNGFLKRVNGQLEKQGRAGRLTLEEEPADFDAGFMVIGEESDVNCSFDILLDDVRAACEKEVAAILFEDRV